MLKPGFELKMAVILQKTFPGAFVYENCRILILVILKMFTSFHLTIASIGSGFALSVQQAIIEIDVA